MRFLYPPLGWLLCSSEDEQFIEFIEFYMELGTSWVFLLLYQC